MASGGSLPLQIQRLASDIDRVLVIGYIAGTQIGDGWFSSTVVGSYFDKLRLPKPSNISGCLGRLRTRRLVVQNSTGKMWSLSPEGREKVLELFADIDTASIEADLVGYPGVEFAHVRHLVIPPAFAPPQWAPAIARLLERFPFEKNVFCMTRFPKSDDANDFSDPVWKVVDTLRTALKLHGLTLHLASDRQADDSLLGNVGAHMWACQYGIGLLEDRVEHGLNYNLIFEIGSMLMTGRRCAIFKDYTIESPPTDLVGQIYKSVDFSNLVSIAEKAHLWASEDLGLGRCAQCPLASEGIGDLRK